MVARIVSTLVLCAALLGGLQAQVQTSGIQYSIQLYDQTLYYEGDEIKIKATIFNNSSEPYRFRLADTRAWSMSFDVRTISNVAMQPSREYVTIISKAEPVFVRDVTILPGEDFSWIETLNAYSELETGNYVISSSFHPDLLRVGKRAPLISNRLALNVRPAVRKVLMAEEVIQQEITEILRAEKLPPDEVVKYTLQALQRDQQRAFFLYLDATSLLKNIDQRRAEAYRRMSELARVETLKTFMDEIWQARLADTGSGFNRKPTSFVISQTSYTSQGKGTVVAMLKYKSEGFTELKEFKYILEKQQDIWKIVDYQVNNMGTE